MAQQISAAKVTGKSQNRTALGMMHAYMAMYPNSTVNELKAKFSKQRVCPDVGMDEVLMTFEELEQAKTGPRAKWYIEGNACFVEDGEWLILANGQKVGFNKMWTASSLELLQKEMLKHRIFSQVDKACKGTNGFDIVYNYKPQYQYADYEEEEATGLPAWVWVVGAIILIALVFFAYKFFMN